ncbi:MAG TPA: hypothetical protein VM580_31940, partial [Labilithrix sp.]|nr:hypothetical protein [Labilithrix sp.]
VELELEDGRVIEIRLGHRADADIPRRTAMFGRIAEGLAKHRALAPSEDEAFLLRGPRSLDGWLDELHLLGKPGSLGYRAIAIPRDRLWAVLENPSAAPSARRGAALALHAGLDDEERERLVSVAQKSASPHLRVALDVIARVPERAELRVALEATEIEHALEDIDDAPEARMRDQQAK